MDLDLQVAQDLGVLPILDLWHANHEILQLAGVILPGWVEVVPAHWLLSALSLDTSGVRWDYPAGWKAARISPA